jgi:hypothetical protein
MFDPNLIAVLNVSFFFRIEGVDRKKEKKVKQPPGRFVYMR